MAFWAAWARKDDLDWEQGFNSPQFSRFYLQPISG